MDEAERTIPQDEHKKQIAAYSKELPVYTSYAKVLKRVLETACTASIPQAFIQSREKTVSSFAEKCVRKFDKYKDAVNDLTDLCGARVIVQTVEQVKAVRQFIEANFQILEKDDKGLQLSEDKFGYRDMHYIIRLKPDCCESLQITSEEQASIGERRAEVQVRTWLQHAWADTLHDRMYKTSLTPSAGLRRTGALLAALMEEGDRNFNLMAEELDGMVANYTAFASRKDVEKEIGIQSLILTNEPENRKKPGLALKLARLLGACGDYAGVVDTLRLYCDINDGNRPELLQHLGYALCKANRTSPDSREFLEGKRFLEESLRLCVHSDRSFVPNLRKQESLRARAFSFLGWVEGRMPFNDLQARKYHRQAHECEPANPYYLADMLGFEMKFDHSGDLPAALRTAIREAVTTCLGHAAAGIELPYAYFTAGRLSLLLGESLPALGYYARGIKHVLDGEYCFPEDVMEEEITWVKRLHDGIEPAESHLWVEELLALGLRVGEGIEASSTSVLPVPKNTLILTGGAATMNEEGLKEIRPLLETALDAFQGTAICGGTIVGVPGLVGEIAAALGAKGRKHFELVSYIPKHLPHDAPKDERYDRHIPCGHEKFTPEQIFCSWRDLLDEGVNPRHVSLLGFGGGPLSALEYRIALAFGSSVAIFATVEGASKDLSNDILWSRLPNLLPLPFDVMSVHAFLAAPSRLFGKETLEEMAMSFHANYIEISSGKLPDPLKPWPDLKDTFRTANIEQAGYSVHILEACGFTVREAPNPVIFQDFSDDDIEKMAEMEHGRWNAERLRDGWRFGSRNDAEKLHDCLLPWSELPEGTKKYDRESVRKFPTILAKAGLEIYRGGKE